jgi:hypothetical protein
MEEADFMKRIGIGTLALMVALTMVSLFRIPQNAHAQDEPQKGSLEGKVRTDSGEPVHAAIRWSRNGDDFGLIFSDSGLNEVYTINNLPPGIYEVRAEREGYRPQRIFGVVIKPGVRSILNVTLHKGQDVEEIGQPILSTQPVLVISNELERLQKEIDVLKNK